MTDTNKLEDLIRDSGYKRSFLCEQMGISGRSLSNKVNNKTEFTASEIFKLSELLRINCTQQQTIFFSSEVDELPTK